MFWFVDPGADRYESFAPISDVTIAGSEAVGSTPPAPWWQTPYRAELTRYEMRVTLSRAQLAERSPALRLSGPFSARVFLNGRLIGEKGRPASARDAERAGPIDVLLPLGNAAHAGANSLVVETSSHRAGYRPTRVFNELAIRDFSSDGRRSFDLYRMALAQTGLLAVLSVAFFWMGAARRNAERPVYLLGIAGLCLLSAFGGEIFRAVISYPYSWHMGRQLWIWISLVAFGCMLTLYVARLRPKVAIRFLAPGWAAIVCVSLLFQSPDSRNAATAAGMIVFAAILALRRKGWTGHAFASACIPLVVLLYVEPGRALDNALYLLIAPPLLVLGAEAFGASNRREAAEAEERLRSIDVGLSAGPVDSGDIRRIEAAGNYAELHLKDGSHLLVRTSLSSIDRQARQGLLRVHRSHLVNPDCMRSVRCEVGSRYFVLLDEGAVPASRRMVDTIRRRIGAGR